MIFSKARSVTIPFRIFFATSFLFIFSANAFSQEKWYYQTCVYQIYPRSFYDSDGNGTGDLKGIISKLDYIKGLGFETIWISPFFKSEQKDFGYDISDYLDVAPEYGTRDEADELIKETHKRGMKIVFDLVMNHTSDKNQWFIHSVSGKDNKNDWYLWHEGRGKKGNKPPNNWKSMLGRSGWHYSEEKKKWYWASFLPFQPDLNYYNPQVKDTMLAIVKYWLGKGADGFRLDIFNAIYEDSLLRNNPFSFRPVPSETNANGFFQRVQHTINHPNSFLFARELRKVSDSFQNPERFVVGEVFGKPDDIKNYTQSGEGLQLVFLFKFLNPALKANWLRNMIEDFERDFQGPMHPTYVLGNHDKVRRITGLGKNAVARYKLLTTLQYTARGVPFTYYGEEIGMKQAALPLKNALDPLAHRFKPWQAKLAKMAGYSFNRDECRTPMQWNASANAGFTTTDAKPWLPVNSDFKEINVEKESSDTASLLNHYKKLLSLRKQHRALHAGSLSFAGLEKTNSRKVLAYYRKKGQESILVIMNCSKKTTRIKMDISRFAVLMGIPLRMSNTAFFLGPYESVILRESKNGTEH